MANSRHAITTERILTAVRRYSRRDCRATTRAVAHHLGMSEEWARAALQGLADAGKVRACGYERWSL